MESLTITPKNETSRGSFCLFVKLDETRGIKFYRDPEERDDAMALQEAASLVGCGPGVHGKAEMDFLPDWVIPYAWNKIPARVYGYVTDLVKPCEITREEFKLLQYRLSFHGLSLADMAPSHNVGKTLNGIPVKYDYDPVMNSH